VSIRIEYWFALFQACCIALISLTHAVLQGLLPDDVLAF
jgi:hypothetical protein